MQRIQVGASLLDMQYVYDSVGNVTSITDAANSSQVQTFGYDALNRLTSASTSGGVNGSYNETYSYDAVGNFTNKSDLGAYTYGDSAHKHAVTLAGTNTYRYDPNGNMLTRIKPTTPVTFSQTWDPDNRLGAVIKADALTDYFVYDGDGKRSRKSEYTNLAATLTDTFDSLNNTLWTYTTTYQMTVTDGLQNVLKSVGTGTDYSGNFYRNSNSLSNGQSVSVDFKVDYTDTVAHFAVETTGSPVMRWAVQAYSGTLRVQYNSGAGWVYPKDLVNPVKTNTWYRLTLRVDDLNGFRIEVRERDGAGASGTYTYPMPAGQSWRFHHWIYRNTAYLDNFVESTDSVLSTVFIGNHFEQDLIAGNGVRTYYYLGGKRVATGNATGLYFIHGDHLGSASLTTSITGTVVSQMLFKPYGIVRWWTGTLETDYRYTGQRQESNIGLYDYGARFYDNQLGRFVSADSIVPGAGNPQALNRYAYSYNNPVNYTDPSGHCPARDDECQENQQQIASAYRINLTGDWSEDNLVLLRDSLETISRGVGGMGVFQAIWKGIEFQRIRDDTGNWYPQTGRLPWDSGSQQSPFAGLTTPWFINIYDKFDAVTVAHELGHAWDYRTGGQLTGGLMRATGSEYLESFGRRFNDPSVMDSSIFKGFADIGFLNSPEDWAQAFAGYIYPEAGLARIVGGSGTKPNYSFYSDANYSRGNSFVGQMLQQYNALRTAFGMGRMN